MDTSFSTMFQNQINCKKVSFELPLAKAGGNSKKIIMVQKIYLNLRHISDTSFKKKLD